MSRLCGQLPEVFKRVKRQATSFKRQATLDKVTIYDYIGDMKAIKKKLVKQVKISRPSLAQEIKDMPMKDFRALWFVVQQGLKIKKKH